MPQEHDFVEAFRDLTVALKQSEGTISLDESVTTPFQHTAIPSDTTGLEDFANVILQKGLFIRLDATAVYTVVFTALQYPPCPMLSKIVYNMLENLLVCKNVTKLSSKSRDQSIEWIKETKKRSKVISTVLMKRLRETLLDVKRDVRIRRLVAEMIAALCVEDKRACTVLASDETASSIGNLFRHSTDPVLRFHIGDVARHLKANDIEMNQIWGDRTDEDAMDFPSSAELTSPEAEKLFRLMEKMQSETGAPTREATMYRISQIHVSEHHIHSSSNDSAIVLSEDIDLFILGKEKIFDHYQTRVNEHVNLESADDSGGTTVLRITWTNNKGFWSRRGVKRATNCIELQFAERGIRQAFIENFGVVKARISQESTVNNQVPYQETQKLSMPVLRFSEDADNTDIEDILVSSPDEPRTRKDSPLNRGIKAAETEQPMSETIVNQHQPTSAIFKTRTEAEMSEGGELTKPQRITAAKAQFLKKVTSERVKQKTPRLTKRDEFAVNGIPTSPLRLVDGNKNRVRKSAKPESISDPRGNGDVVLTKSLEQQEDADYEAFHGQGLAYGVGPLGIQEDVHEATDGFEGDSEMPFDLYTSRMQKSFERPASATRSVSQQLPQTSSIKGPKARLNPVKTDAAKKVLVRSNTDSQSSTRSDPLRRKTRSHTEVDYDEHLKVISTDEDPEELGFKSKKSRVGVKQRDRKPSNVKTKGEEVQTSVAKKKRGQVKSKTAAQKIATPSFPKGTRRSQRTAAQNPRTYAEQKSSEEEHEGTAVQADQHAGNEKAASKSKAKVQKTLLVPTQHGIHTGNHTAVPHKQTAVVLNSSDGEYVSISKGRTSAAKGSAARANIPQNSNASKDKAHQNDALIQVGEEDTVEDSYPQENFSRNHTRTDDDLVNVPEGTGGSRKYSSKRKSRGPGTDNATADKIIKHTVLDTERTVPHASATNTTKSTTIGSGKARPSDAGNGSARNVEHPRRPSLVHFGPDGPANQGPVPAKSFVHNPQQHTTPETRYSNGHAKVSSLARLDLNASSHVRRTAEDYAHNTNTKVQSIHKSASVSQDTDQYSLRDTARGIPLHRKTYAKPKDFDTAISRKDHETGSADEEVASGESCETSSVVVLDYNQQEQPITPSVQTETQDRSSLHNDCSHQSEVQSDKSDDSDDLSPDIPSSEPDSDDSESEASLQTNEDLSAHIVRLTRQTHAATNSSLITTEAAFDLVEANEIDRHPTRNRTRPYQVESMTQAKFQVQGEEDVIARMARERNPGAQKKIQFHHFQSSTNTFDVFGSTNTRDALSTTTKFFNFNSTNAAGPESRTINSMDGSPRRASISKDLSMPPPPKPVMKTNNRRHQDLDNPHVSHNLADSRSEGNSLNGQMSKLRRLRPSAARCTTPVVEEHCQSTPLPYAAHLLATKSPTSNSANSDNYNGSEAGGTTLVDVSYLIRNDESRSASVTSSQLLEASASPQSGFEAQVRVDTNQGAEHLSNTGEDLRRNIEASVMAITQQVLIRLDTEERLSKTLVDTHRRGCFKTMEELRKNAIVRVRHDAGKAVSSAECTKNKLYEAYTVVTELHSEQVRMNNRPPKGVNGSVDICKSMLEEMLKKKA